MKTMAAFAVLVLVASAVPLPAGQRLTRGIFSGRSRAARAAAVGGEAGTSEEAEKAVAAGLQWLAKAQEDDGRWSCEKWGGRAGMDTGISGLALLAILGAGHTHTSGPFQPTVRKGLGWLEEQLEPKGRFKMKTFYEQGIATMALCEAYGLTRDPRVGKAARSALRHIIQEQPDHGGFRYTGGVARDQGDLSVSGWQMTALALGRCAGLTVPQAAVDRSRRLLGNAWRGHGGSAYTVGSDNAGSLAVSSIGMLCRMLLGNEKHDDEIHQTANLLFDKETNDGQVVEGGRTKQLVTNLYYTYYASLAMFQAGDGYWTKWNAMYREPLAKAQVQAERDAKGRFTRGSWDPAKHRFAKGAGRVYATAMAVLCLETCYRFRRVYPKTILPQAEF